MKQLLGTLAFVIMYLMTNAQTSKALLRGEITDEKTKQAVAYATVSLNKQLLSADENGGFVFTKLEKGKYLLKVKAVGYTDFEQSIQLNNNEENIRITLMPEALFLQPLEVKSIRAGDKAPFSKANLTKEEIAKLNLGQDLPFILNQTPSVVVNADAGNGIGYTGIRIRGTDATRINVTLNGIPYNDAESQGTFFVNLPDFTSSVNSIQLQRGVGTSSNGTGAFGATINLSTNEHQEKPYAEINNSVGSFNTWKHTVKAGSGLINNHFTIDARLSKITSDGYVDRASSNLQSFFLSAAYLNKKASVRFNIFSGKEKTYQAWNGVPEQLLPTNRTYNASGTEKTGEPYDNETDNYQQTHYQLFYNQEINTRWSFNTAFFLTRGAGYYETYKADQRYSNYGLPNVVIGGTTINRTDLIRQLWLDNYFYGQIFSLQYKQQKNTLTIGGGWSNYDGKHIGKVIWAKNGGVNDNHTFYNTPAFKTDFNLYTKLQHQIQKNLDVFVDVQYRNVTHWMNGFRNNPTLYVNRKFNFFNPKAGITYTKNGWQSFISYAMAGKEPNRDDFEAGLNNQPKAEMLHDLELGIEKKTNNWQFGFTAFYMLYKNQLVLTGQINDVGAYTRANVPNSYRTGIELQGSYRFTDWLNMNANITVSQNKIKAFTEYADDYDNNTQIAIPHTNTNIAFSPAIVSSSSINILPIKQLELSVLNKYVGKQYLDNTQNSNRSLKPFFIQDIRASYSLQNKLLKTCTFVLQVNNIFNTKYEPNGYTYSYVAGGQFTTENFYFPMAGTNLVFAVNVKL